MSKVTSKYQVSIPKGLADRLGIRVGDDLQWEEAGGTLRARVGGAPDASASGLDIPARLRLFDAATERQAARERTRKIPKLKGRGWKRVDLYDR
jgi:AbrB family looped-hinge helix DNA binding protein